MVTLQRETDDWVYVPLLQAGAAYTGAWSYQIVPYMQRPGYLGATWVPAVENGGARGVDVVGLASGHYWIWPRIDGQDPYVPVTDPILLVIA
jgi:hypothetical protein